MGEVSIRPAAPADLREVLDLMQLALGDEVEFSERFFKWKHLANPFGESPMLVAVHRERIIGARTMMRWRFQARELVEAVRPVDTTVHPDWRRRGLFSQLTRRFLDSLPPDVRLIFNTPNEKSWPGYAKLGWREVGHPSIWIRPIGPGLTRRRSVPQHPGSPVLATTGGSRLRTFRSIEYDRWRWSPESGVDYSTASGNESTVRFRERSRAGRRELTVVDIQMKQRSSIPEAAALLRGAVRGSDALYAIAIAAAFTREAAALALAGFIPIPKAGPRLVTRGVPGATAPGGFDRLTSWRLQVGDLELF
ncbi:MAG: GNAT family N-acetyltransferase [Myxococcota bacterium]